MSNHRVPLWRLGDIVACGLCIATLLASVSASAQLHPGAPAYGARPAPGGSVNSPAQLSWPGLPGIVGPSTDDRAPAPTEPAEPDANEVKTLLAAGPQLPLTRPADQFEAVGLFKGNWPLVIDFKPAPNSCTYVVVVVGGKATVPAVIDPDGHIGRHLFWGNFSGMSAERLWPARYRVQSETPACPSQHPAANGADAAPSPLEIYGIGAGPRAVGSITVTDLHIGPPQPDLRKSPVTWSFKTEWVFNHATITFLRFERSPRDGSIVSTPVRSFAVPSLEGSDHSGQWDAHDNAGHLSPGIHRLEVRAWDSRDDDKSWASGISNDVVTITHP